MAALLLMVRSTGHQRLIAAFSFSPAPSANAAGAPDQIGQLSTGISIMTFQPRIPIVRIRPVSQGVERFLRRRPRSADEAVSSTISDEAKP
jgi:hypothetical protein